MGHLKVKCQPCGHVWIAAYLPMPAEKIRHFTKVVCPKCFDRKPTMAGASDLTAEERMQSLLRRAHSAMDACQLKAVTNEVWDSIITDIKAELDHG